MSPTPAADPAAFGIQPGPRFQLTLGLTYACNLACEYCYVDLESAAVLPAAQARRALELGLAAVEPGGTLDLGFFGGEPLLEAELLLELVAEARAAAGDRRVRVALTTNGTRLTPALAARLARAGVELTVSLDGGAAAHDRLRPSRGGGGSHAAALAGLRAALAAGLDPAVHLVVDPRTLPELDAGVGALLATGVRRVVLGPNFDAAWGPADLAELARQYRALGRRYLAAARAGRPFALSFVEEKIGRFLTGGACEGERCAFGAGELAVDPRGRLFPCERLMRDGGGDEHVVGDVVLGVDPARLERLRAPLADPAPECGGCAIRQVCTAWCPCTNLSRTGHPARPDGLVCALEALAVEIAGELARELYPAATERRLAV